MKANNKDLSKTNPGYLKDSLLKGKQEACILLYDNYAPPLLGLFSTVFPLSNEAEELTLHTFAAAFKNAHDFDESKTSFFTWLIQLGIKEITKHKSPEKSAAFKQSLRRAIMIQKQGGV